jgi:hypothetical protein
MLVEERVQTTDLLDDDLCTKVESPQTNTAQDRATNKARCRDGRLVKKKP